MDRTDHLDRRTSRIHILPHRHHHVSILPIHMEDMDTDHMGHMGHMDMAETHKGLRNDLDITEMF